MRLKSRYDLYCFVETISRAQSKRATSMFSWMERFMLPLFLMMSAMLSSLPFSLTASAQTDLQKAQNLATCLAGRYPALCRHAWLSPEDGEKVEIAERRENLKTCLTGRYPALCKKAKLSQDELQQVLAAEKQENLKTCLAGKYQALCKKHLLTNAELEQVIAAEHAENLKNCLSGLHPSLCNRTLLTREQLAQAQEAEKRVGEATAAAPRSQRIRRGGSAGCEDGHWIDSVSSDGTIVKLEDRSVWEVDAVDAIDSALWLPTTDIITCDGKLINTDDNETVSARRLR